MVGEEADAELGDLIADETAVMPGRELESRNLIKELRGVLHVLDARERAILSLRFPSRMRPRRPWNISGRNSR